ncbi:PQQ-binding-like beta-propeller repeat protein [Haloferula sp.]|uniref:outer membrane protein assembly factor BamB family protein n=1 Tax=Haloferula sp. TaxID=2497595 RepID=UPI003C75A9DB
MKLPNYLLALTATMALPSLAEDWPMWGRTPDRNMVGNASNLPTEINPGEIGDDEQVDLSSAKNILWATKLGSQTYGNTVVADGRVYVGTNNEVPRNPKQTGDRGVLMVFDEKTGDFLWQLIIPKLGAGKVSDWEYVGLCSSPVVQGDKAYIVTNRGEVVCLDTAGMSNGNAGPFKDEAKYSTADPAQPYEVGPESADIIWIYDMREELGVFPHNVSSCSPVIVDGILYTATSNGVDWSHTNIPAPLAPALVALDVEKGTLVGEEISGVSERVLHASWSSPAYGKLGGKDRIVWGGGDGFAYAFEPKPTFDEDEELDVLKEVWSFDVNPVDYRFKGGDPKGEPIKYATFRGPSEIIGTTVVYDDHVYAVSGQDPEHGDGIGILTCFDASGKPVWTFKDIGRSISTASIHDGLIYQAEYDGDLHCIDIKTGKQLWVHETQSRIWGSTLVADGKVFLPTEDGEVHVLATGREKKELGLFSFDAPIYSSPIVANDVLYIATMTHLYAIKSK